MLQEGLVSISFRQLTAEQIIAEVRRSGLSCIEWGGDVHVPHGDLAHAKAVREQTAAGGPAVSAYGSYYQFLDILSQASGAYSPEGRLPGPTFQTVLDTAVALGAPVIRIWAGPKASADFTPLEYEIIVRHSRVIADMAAVHGIRIAFEFHGNTLTDSNESALRLLSEIDHPNVRSFWQPPVGRDVGYCLEGLVALAPFLECIHCFHWGEAGSKDRRPLAEGWDRWKLYLKTVTDLVINADHRATTTLQPAGPSSVPNGAPRSVPVLLEFVRDDDPAMLVQDAQTLRSWLKRFNDG